MHFNKYQNIYSALHNVTTHCVLEKSIGKRQISDNVQMSDNVVGGDPDTQHCPHILAL